MFIRKVSQFIEEKHLFGSGDKVLVALSGGADSVALLRVLLRLGYAFHTRRSDGKRIMEISKITWLEGENVNENRFYQ